MLQANPLLPSTDDPKALLLQVQKLIREVNLQVTKLSTGKASALLNAQPTPPTTAGSDGDFVPNSQKTPLGPDGAKYIVDGWEWVGGNAGQWLERRVAVASPPNVPPAPTPAAPAPTPAPGSAPYSYRFQAENMTGATAVTTVAGYDGTGHADEATTSGVTFTATFTGVPAGTFDINIRYYTFSDQHNEVQIDAGTVTDYAYPTSYPNWAIQTISGVSLTAGTHTVKLISNYGFQFYDYVELVQQSAAAPPPPAPAPAPAPAPGSAPFVPFGSRVDGAYPHTGSTVTAYTTSQQDALVKSCYDAWKNNRLKAAADFTPTAGIYAGQPLTGLYFVDAAEPITPASATSPGIFSATVSEAIGYGLLIAVAMAGYETNAHAIFDGLLKYSLGLPAYGMPSTSGANTYLMEWRLGTRSGQTGTATDILSSQGGGYNASDGDMDRALACLMAHRQWGSAGAINYYQIALNIIAAIKAVNFASNGVQYLPQNLSRTSDYMPGHFRAFKAATNDTFWDDARTNSLALINTIVSGFSASAHLTPGFIDQPLSAAPFPSGGGRIESAIEGDYDNNAIRNPWRWGTDVVWSGDTGWKSVTTNIVATLKTACSGDPNQTTFAYKLDATPLGNLYFSEAQCGCLMVGAMVDAAHQTFLDALFTKVANNFNPVYFTAELMLLPLIVASGNWWKAL